MRAQATLLLALLGCGLFVASAYKAGSDFGKDEKERFGKCKPLVNQEGCDCSQSADSSSSSKSAGGSSEEGGDGGDGGLGGSGSGNSSGSGSGDWEHSGSGSGSGSGLESGSWEEGEYCFLIKIILEFSLTLEVEFRDILVDWCNVTQFSIINGGLFTEYEILVKIYYELEALYVEYPEIKLKMRWIKVGEWGLLGELEGLALDIQTSEVEITISQTIEIDVSGSCLLFEALREAVANGTSADQEAVEELIAKLKVVIEGYHSESETLVLVFEVFLAFSKQHPGLHLGLLKKEIQGFGSINAFFDLCNVHWRIKNFGKAVGGDVAPCANGNAAACGNPLIKVLILLYQDTQYSTSQRSDFKQLELKIEEHFKTEHDDKARVKYFSEELYQFFILEEWNIAILYELEIAEYGSVYDLIYAFIYCENNGVGPGDFTVSDAPTTTTTSTTTTTTTTKPNGNCGTVTGVNVVTANITLLLKSIDKDQAEPGKWTSSEVTQFSGYKKRIYNISINGTYTLVQKFNQIKTVLTGFAGQTTVIYKKVHAVFIETWGTIAQYCACSL